MAFSLTYKLLHIDNTFISLLLWEILSVSLIRL